MELKSHNLREMLHKFEENTSNLSDEQKILAEQTKIALESIAGVVDKLADNFRM